MKDGDEVVGNGREKQVAGSVGYKDKNGIPLIRKISLLK